MFTVLVYVLFAFLEPQFATVENFFVILRQSAITGLLALGLTLVIVSGEFDLSFAGVATLTGVIFLVLVGKGMNMALAGLIVFALGAAIGALNSLLVLKLRVPAFVATLGVSGLTIGFARMVTGGTTYFPLSLPAAATFIGRGFVFRVVPFQVVIFLIGIAIMAFILEASYLGRNFYATGGNPTAALHVGIDVVKLKIWAYIVCGVFAVTGGITTVSMLGAANAETCVGYQMPAISAAYMGGVFLKGGLPNVWGTAVASFLMAMLSNGFVMLGFPQYLKEIVHGIVLLVAVSMVTSTSNKK